jgi:peptidoglycan/xylan/chitin deacetylase (PgdA/CDA1 family)
MMQTLTHFIERAAVRMIHIRLLSAYSAWRIGAKPKERRAYLKSDKVLFSFDDFGSSKQIHNLLEVLRHEQVEAMFFLNGNWTEEHPYLVDAIKRDGHVVGNHTYSHRDLDTLTDDEAREEISRGPKSVWLRPPRGRYNKRIREIATSLGYRICFWTIDSDDWKKVPAKYIEGKVMDEMHPGAVVLFHLHSDETIKALPLIISAVRAKGLELWGKGELSWKN